MGDDLNVIHRIVLPFSFFLVFFPAIFSTQTLLSRYDVKRIFLLLLITSLSGFFLARLFYTRKSTHNITSTPVALVFVAFLGIASSYDSGFPVAGYLEVCIFLLSVVAIKELAHCTIETASSDHYILALTGFTVGSGLYLLGAATITLSARVNNLPMPFPDPIYGFANVRFFNQYATWLLPLVTVSCLVSPPKALSQNVWRISCVITAVMLWALVWHSNGRGTLVSMLLAISLVALIGRRGGRIYAGVALIQASLGAGLAAFTLPNDARLVDGSRYGDFSSPGRLDLWSRAIHQITDHPWLGVGPMQFAYGGDVIANHPHNAVLQVAAEWGLPTAILLCATLALLGWKWLRFVRASTSPDNRPCPADRYLWYLALTASITAAAADSLVSGIVVMPQSQLLLVLILGLAVGSYQTKTVTQQEKTSLKPVPAYLFRIAFGTMVSIAITTVLFITSRDLRTIVSNRMSNDGVIELSLKPRFWHRGLPILRPSGDMNTNITSKN